MCILHYSTLNLGLTTFQVCNSLVWLVATIVDSTVLTKLQLIL